MEITRNMISKATLNLLPFSIEVLIFLSASVKERMVNFRAWEETWILSLYLLKIVDNSEKGIKNQKKPQKPAFYPLPHC